MNKFGLIGHPIAHSLSPDLFKAAFGGRYTYDLIEGEDFEKAYDKFMNEYDAINVTAPFKELAFKKADNGRQCEAIGAANILKKNELDLFVTAYNSDIEGVTGALKEAGAEIHPCKKKALVVGCGGAAMAAAYSVWFELGYETVIVNRNFDKAQDYATKMTDKRLTSLQISADTMDSFERHFLEADIIVYTLPLAIPAMTDLSRRAIRGGGPLKRRQKKIILEANYKDPAFTPEIMKRMRRINPDITFVSGKEWLLHQAIGAYKIFTSETPNIENMRKVL
jgi:shikimate dehydrogenase